MKKYCFQIGFILTLQIAAASLFTIGFLIIGTQQITRNNISAINESSFDRLIIIVVDAMRFDMGNSFPDLPDETTPEFINRVPLIHQLLEQRPQQSAMYKFISDMPTVTTSRLKCITTGAVPAFIDIGTSFSGSSITEDNLLDQLVFGNRNTTEQEKQCQKNDKNIWVLGDDTWTQLYPSQNESSQCSVWSFIDVVPSFTVTAFHENDRTVLRTLVPQILELKNKKHLIKPNWDAFIGHFLGIDHIMHVKTLKNYQYNPDLSVKIDQIDSVLRILVDFIDREEQEIIQEEIKKRQNKEYSHNNNKQLRKGTLLCVFGDHGMTEEGTHGGQNREETDATLFLYSPKPLIAFTTQNEIGQNKIQQNEINNNNISQQNNNNFLQLSRPECVKELEQDEKRWMKNLKEKAKLQNQSIITNYIAQDRHCRATLLTDIPNQYNNQLIFNTNHLNNSNCTSCYPTIRQIDLTPTLAYLFNVPVPYTSIGKGMTEWATVMEQEDIIAATIWKDNIIKQQLDEQRSQLFKEQNEQQKLKVTINPQEQLFSQSLSSYFIEEPSLTDFTYINNSLYKTVNKISNSSFIWNLSDDPLLQHDFDLLEYFYQEKKDPVPPKTRQYIQKLKQRKLPKVLIDLEDLQSENVRKGIFEAIELNRIEIENEQLTGIRDINIYNQQQNNNSNQYQQQSNFISSMFHRIITFNLHIMKQWKISFQDQILNHPFTAKSKGLQQYNTVTQLDLLINEIEQIQIEDEQIKQIRNKNEYYERKNESQHEIDKSEIINRQLKFLNETQNLLYETSANMDRIKMKFGWIISILAVVGSELIIIFWKQSYINGIGEKSDEKSNNNTNTVIVNKQQKQSLITIDIVQYGIQLLILVHSFIMLTFYKEIIGLIGISAYLVLLICASLFNLIEILQLSFLGISITFVGYFIDGYKSIFVGSLIIFSSIIVQIIKNIKESRNLKSEIKKKEIITDEYYKQFLYAHYPLIFLLILIIIHFANTTSSCIEYEQNMHQFFLIVIILYQLINSFSQFSLINGKISQEKTDINVIKQKSLKSQLFIEVKSCIGIIIIIGISLQFSGKHSNNTQNTSFSTNAYINMKNYFDECINNLQIELLNSNISSNNNQDNKSQITFKQLLFSTNSLLLKSLFGLLIYFLYVIIDFFFTYKLIKKIYNNILTYQNHQQQDSGNQFQQKLHIKFAQILFLVLFAIQKILFRSNFFPILQPILNSLHPKFRLITNVMNIIKIDYSYAIPKFSIFILLPIIILIDIITGIYNRINMKKKENENGSSDDNNNQNNESFKSSHLLWIRTGSYVIIPLKLLVMNELGNIGYFFLLYTLHFSLKIFISQITRKEIEEEKQTFKTIKKRKRNKNHNLVNSNISYLHIFRNPFTASTFDKYKSQQNKTDKTTGQLNLSHDLIPGLFIWLLSNYFFFSTGNHSHFGAVDLNAGFAFQSDFDFQKKFFLSASGVFSAAMCVFGSFLICIPFLTILSRLSVIADKNIQQEIYEDNKINKEQKNDRIERKYQYLHHLQYNHPYAHAYILFQGVDFMSNISFIYFRTGHLWMFNVFAPKFLFNLMKGIVCTILLLILH